MSDVKKCYTCAHWRGDREKVKNLLRDLIEQLDQDVADRAMDPREGYAPYGDCPQLRIYFGIIDHLAEYGPDTSETPAGFGCDLWEENDDDASRVGL